MPIGFRCFQFAIVMDLKRILMEFCAYLEPLVFCGPVSALTYIIFFNPLVRVKLKNERRRMIQKLWERIIKELYSFRVTTRRECMTSISITVSCVKTNPSKSSLVYSNSGSIFGLTFYDASTNVHGRQTLSLCRTVNPEDKRRIIGDMFVKVIDRTANDLNVTWDLLLGQAVPSAVLFRVASDRGWLLKRTVVQGGTWLGVASTFLEVSSGDVIIYWVFEMYLMCCGGRKIIQ
ncbi:hypothetical protein OUZ56_015528 [Daphnia magna]|uniref:Uncharacterized protein n=1 Tax=Daphnia magna TaxID=35525 RepID=A0ABR0AN36_9CRUS|nr:hypothetical protein OUZ56_015528 [Daphnia magna]